MIGIAPLKAVAGRWWFVIAVLTLYGAVALADPEMARTAFGSFVSLLIHVVPPLVMVYALILLFNAFAEPKWITRYVGPGSGLKGWVVALIGGVLSLGPIYPWYALLGEMKDKGMRPALVAAFLYARAVKPPLLPLLGYYFGLLFTAVLIGYMLLFAVLNGVLTESLAKNRVDDTTP